MNNEQRKNGFSLTEVLLAVGVLAIGMLFVAGVFPVGIHFTTIATERTIAAVAADEAFAKIRLYGVNASELAYNQLTPLEDPNVTLKIINPEEFAYPSTSPDPTKHYCWSALCRRIEGNLVQVTVFVCRRTSPNLRYCDPDGTGTVDWPMPVRVEVDPGNRKNELQITGDKTLINDGYTIIDNRTGRLYRVLQRYKSPRDNTILLDRDWDDSEPGGQPKYVWVVPPPAGGGRYPCIAIYQRVIGF